MVGLRKGWRRRPIICTRETAALLQVGRDVDPEYIRIVNLDDPFDVYPDAKPVRVTALDANHCPGAVMFLFERGDERILVTGDFRLDDRMRAMLPLLKGLDVLYVDATYREPGYTFPPQEKVIADILDYIETCKAKYIVVETYNIGKNKILRAIHEAFNEPIFLDPHRVKLYEAIGDGPIVTSDPHATRFFACARRYMYEELGDILPGWEQDAVILSPKGWAAQGRWTQGKVGFPYSEHCSWDELREFVTTLAPQRLQMTEGGRIIGQTLSFD
jgi:DNA cross-link repair 1A protein